MIGKRNGVIALFQAYNVMKASHYHCIQHQEVLCAKVMDFEHVMRVMSSVVVLIVEAQSFRSTYFVLH